MKDSGGGSIIDIGSVAGITGNFQQRLLLFQVGAGGPLTVSGLRLLGLRPFARTSSSASADLSTVPVVRKQRDARRNGVWASTGPDAGATGQSLISANLRQ